MKRLKAAMCAVLAGLMLAGCAVQPQTDNKRGGGAAVDLTKYVVKEAAYPAYPKEPRFEDYFDEDGEGDWDAYDAAYTEYREALQKLGKLDAEPDGGAVLAFANRTLGRIFADSENRVYSPISLYAALSMLTEMTAGETKQQVMELLGAADSETLRQTVCDLWMKLQVAGQRPTIITSQVAADQAELARRGILELHADEHPYAARYYTAVSDPSFETAD